MFNQLRILVPAALLAACSGSDTDGFGPLNLTNFQEAAVVIGQMDGTTRGTNAGQGSVNAVGISSPFGGPTRDGGFYVPDQGNRRLLGFDGIPNADGEAADYVVGQADALSNETGTASATRFSAVDCWVYDGRLFLVDLSFHRVLIWNTVPKGDEPADVVVGQTNFTATTSGLSASKLNTPIRVRVAGGKLFVLEFSNHRCLIWNSIPTTNGQPADVVVGQRDFTTNTTALNDWQFGSPRALWTDGRRLIIGDSNNRRLLVWNSIPTTNGEPADLVVGQPDFTTRESAIDAQHLGSPFGIDSDGFHLYVADTGFQRVLVFPFPTENFPTAVTVLGQSDFDKSGRNDDDQDGQEDPGPTRRTLLNPTNVVVVGRRLYVSDQSNHRVVVYQG